MLPRLLLDTHILLRWLTDNRKLSHKQLGVLDRASHRPEPIAFSGVTLLEIAVLVSAGRFSVPAGLEEFFQDIESNPMFCIMPMTYQIALDVTLLGILKDPADRAIVATARVHRLSLVTSDERIIASDLVKVVD